MLPSVALSGPCPWRLCSMILFRWKSFLYTIVAKQVGLASLARLPQSSPGQPLADGTVQWHRSARCARIAPNLISSLKPWHLGCSGCACAACRGWFSSSSRSFSGSLSIPEISTGRIVDYPITGTPTTNVPASMAEGGDAAAIFIGTVSAEKNHHPSSQESQDLR